MSHIGVIVDVHHTGGIIKLNSFQRLICFFYLLFAKGVNVSDMCAI